MSDNRDWIPDEAVANLTVRRALMEDEDPIKLANSVLKETVPLATMSMAHLAIHCPVDSVRYQAAKYVMDRVLGAAGQGADDVRPAWEDIYEAVLVEAEDAKHDKL